MLSGGIMLCPSQTASVNRSSPSPQPFVTTYWLYFQIEKKKKKKGQVVFDLMSVCGNSAKWGSPYVWSNFLMTLGGFRPIMRHSSKNQLDWRCK